MGAVFEAEDETLGRRVALKVIKDETSPNAKARFEREIVAASRIRHPNLVAVHSSGSESGIRYLVSDLVEGESLSAVLKRGALDVERAARIGEKLARAIQALHEAGVVHRDVKPANVLLDATSGEPRLTDFGIARTGESERITKSGDMLGTPAYAPLEQLGLGGADLRADVYALGATLYHMVAGKAPFETESLAGLVAMKRRRVLPPSRWRDDRDMRLDAVCIRCLEPDVGARFATAAELAEAIAQARSAKHVGRRPVAPLVGVALLAAAGLVALAVTRGAGPGAPPLPPAPQKQPPGRSVATRLAALSATLRDSPKKADAAREVLDGLKALRAEQDPGEPGLALELECFLALGRDDDARRAWAKLGSRPAELAWKVALLDVDDAVKGKIPLKEGLAAVQSLTRPNGALDDTERKRGAALLRIVERRLAGRTNEFGILFDLAQALELLARVAPAPLPASVRDAVRGLLADFGRLRGLGPMIGRAASALVPDDDELVLHTARLFRQQDVLPDELAGLARRVIAGGVAENRLPALDILCDALVRAERWSEALTAAADLDRALAGAAGRIPPVEATGYGAKIALVRAAATLGTGDAAGALRLGDEASAFDRVLPESFLLVRLRALIALGRSGEALDAAVQHIPRTPAAGRDAAAIAEIVWALALAADRIRDLRPITEFDAWGSRDSIWALRGAIVLAETGEPRRAAARYGAARGNKVWPSLEAGLERGEPWALSELKALERRVAGK